MSEILNPYIAGAPVTEKRMFFGREDVFDWIEKSLSGQYADHILVVHGQRRVGKTSVLKQLGNRLPKKYIPVFFDLQGRTHTTLDHFLWWLARETVRVLKQEYGIEVPLPEQEDFTKDPEYFENTFLPGLQPALGETSLLYTFDEFDNLEESEVREELARPLTDYLRRLMGRGEMNFIFCIGSSGRKLENMQAAYTEFFKTALYKKISFLSEEQTHGLVTRPVEGVLEFEPAAVERIYRITSGHPYFTQLICHELFARCQRTEQRKIANADVEAVLDDVVERGTVNLKFIWDEAADIEKWSLAGLAHLDKADNRLLADFLRKQHVRFSESDLTSGLLHLREKDVLTPENRFVIHLLRLWLQKNRPIEQVREELTEASPIASRFIEIGLEFRLSGQHAQAIEYFRQALSVSANNLQAQVNIASTYAAQGQLGQAVIEFEKALAIDDEDVTSRSGLCDAHLAMGDAAMKKGRAKDAVLSYQRVLAINAEHLEARQRMAELSCQRAGKALASGRDEEALGAFSEALKYTPEDATLLARVEKVRAEKNARVLAAQVARSEKEAAAGNWDKAIAALNEALETAPGDGSILKKIGRLKEKQLQEQLDAILAKVEAAEKASRWDAAIAGLNEYLRLKPEDVLIQKRIADLVEARHAAWLEGVMKRVDQAVTAQNWDEALTALNEALRLEPGNAEMQARLTGVHAARRLAEQEAMLTRANLAAGAGRWDEAIDILNDGLASDPANETLSAKLAEARQAKREARLQAALRLADGAAQAGRWETAVASLQELLANEPDNLEFRKKLDQVRLQEHVSQWEAARIQAQSLRDAEQFEQALQAWQAYLSLHPEDRERVEEQIGQVTQQRELLDLYTKAGAAIAARDFDGAIRLLKELIIRDENYKDASRLLTRAIESRRTAPRQKQGQPRKKPERLPRIRPHLESKPGARRNWVLGGLLAILALGIGGAVFWVGKNGLPALPGFLANHTLTPTTAALPTLTPTPTGITITVTSAQDSGAGTLRQALLDAQAGDTITFDPGSFPPGRATTIFLTSTTQSAAVLPRISQGGITLDASNAGVILDGSQLQGESLNGLVINSDHNIVMGLKVVNFSGIGIYLEGGSFNTIGGDRTIGTGPFGQGNLLGSNYVGISILSTAGGNVITGNLIGTVGNWKSGILIEDMRQYHPLANTIGPDNIIAYNGTTGAVDGGDITGGIVLDTVEIPTIITANSIYNNTGAGIVFNVDPARIKNQPPAILYFDLESGVVSGQACHACVVEIFSTDTQDGRIYEGSVTADEYDNFTFRKGGALAGPYLTATARSSGNNTSEFSQATHAISDIQVALNALQNDAPLFQTSFDSWDFIGDDGGNAWVGNGKLMAAAEPPNEASININSYNTSRLAVEFEFRILESSPDSQCSFVIINDDQIESSGKQLHAEFNSNGLAGMSRLVYPFNEMDPILVEGMNTLDVSQSNTVILIILGDQIAAFVNGQLVYTTRTPDGSIEYTHDVFIASGKGSIVCEFDNYKFWDLSGVDFSAAATADPQQPFESSMQTYLSTHAPTFEDDFSSVLEAGTWGVNSEDIWIYSLIANGVLDMNDSTEPSHGGDRAIPGVVFPTNNLFVASDFALKFDYSSSFWIETVGMVFGSSRRISTAASDGYTFNITDYGDWSLIQNKDGSTILSGVKPLGEEFNTLLLFVQGGNIAVFLNGELLFSASDLPLSGSYNGIIFKSTGERGGSRATFDNFKFWNLAGVDINP